MTIDERFERIEHLTAGIAEERRKDRDEYKALWRDTQRQINETAANMNRLSLAIADTNEQVHQLADQLAEHAAEAHAADQKLGARIEALVSAIGQFIAKEAK